MDGQLDPVLFDGAGRPVTRRDRAAAKACPQCRGTKRVASGGFGQPHPVCSTCGFEWHGEAFQAEESN